MQKIKVAIIIVNYNGVNDTIECLNSINNSNVRSNILIEIYVVDNKSTNDELSVISNKFPNIIPIQSEINQGFAGGNNIGIRRALSEGSDYILLLNNDTVIDNNMIEELLSVVDDNTIVSPKMLYFSKPDIVWYGGGYIDRHKGNSYHFGMNLKDDHLTEVTRCSFATGCCILIPRKIIQQCGYFEDDYFMYCEDTEYCVRIQEAGYRILYNPNAVLWHKVSASTGGDESPFSIYYMTRNRLSCISKHNKYFLFPSFQYAFLSRIFRMMTSRIINKSIFRAYSLGIKDFLNHKMGRSEEIG
jgi:hypothetical protein